MKRHLTIIMAAAIFLAGCEAAASKGDISKSAVEKKDPRREIWTQLSKQSKQEIIGTWKDGTAQKDILKEQHGVLKDASYIGKEVYFIEFPSRKNLTLGNVLVFADPETNKLIRYGFRD